jgi:hypothetical protein
MVKFLPEVIKGTKAKVVYIAKKDSKYMTIRNGEIGFSSKQYEALASANPVELVKYVSDLCVDDRNMQRVGHGWEYVEIYVR